MTYVIRMGTSEVISALYYIFINLQVILQIIKFMVAIGDQFFFLNTFGQHIKDKVLCTGFLKLYFGLN